MKGGAPVLTKTGGALAPIGVFISDVAEIIKVNEKMDEIENQ
ncbi:MAG: hypothetical protein ACYS80_24740 [Planctomycetota bacterium]